MPSSLARVLSFALGFSPLPTCGGLRYGRLPFSTRGFSWRYGDSRISPAVAEDPLLPQLNATGDLPPVARLPRRTPHVQWGCSAPPSPSPRVSTKGRRCWNFYQLSFAFALRLRLRPRLTLRRLPFRRNPWAFGAPGFHRGCRYSFRDSHSPALHGPFPDPFSAQGTLPYHPSHEGTDPQLRRRT